MVWERGKVEGASLISYLFLFPIIHLFFFRVLNIIHFELCHNLALSSLCVPESVRWTD